MNKIKGLAALQGKELPQQERTTKITKDDQYKSVRALRATFEDLQKEGFIHTHTIEEHSDRLDIRVWFR